MTTLPAISAASTPAPTALVPASSSSGSGFSFGDVLDAVNPFQHIPVISGIYRAMTGSSISSVSQVAGDTLYGGIVGGAVASFASSLADVAVKQATGESIGQHVVATVTSIGNPVTSAVTPSPSATALVASPAGTLPMSSTAPSTPAQQAATAVANLLHTSQPVHSSALYQQTQALDKLDGQLLKMTA